MRRSRSEIPTAVALVLVSGAAMVWAGTFIASRKYATALWVTLPPGVAIEVAFVLVRRADRAVGRAMPSFARRLKQEGAALLSGAAMLLAGYAGTMWSWLLVVPLGLVGGLAISAAADLGRGPSGDAGRFTADIDGDFVVFLIGMRFNKPWKVHKWLPVAMAMPPMLRALDDHPELGCLGYKQWVMGQTTVMVQYWRDFESLSRFAGDTGQPHLDPWRRFNRAVRASGDVGIWHETYRIRAGEYEAVYGNMPTFGLAAAARRVEVGRKGQTAAARIGSDRTTAPAVEPY